MHYLFTLNNDKNVIITCSVLTGKSLESLSLEMAEGVSGIDSCKKMVKLRVELHVML